MDDLVDALSLTYCGFPIEWADAKKIMGFRAIKKHCYMVIAPGIYLEIVGESQMELCRQIWTFLLSVFEKVNLCDYAIDFSKLKKFIEISSYIL